MKVDSQQADRREDRERLTLIQALELDASPELLEEIPDDPEAKTRTWFEDKGDLVIRNMGR